MLLDYLKSSLILTFAIPTFGLILGLILKTIYKKLAQSIGYKKAHFIFNRLSFVGVFHHELSHALLATITGAKVTKIVFFKPEGDRLGYVEYKTRGNIIFKSIQNALSSIAPVLCGCLSLFGLFKLITLCSLPIWALILVIYAMISIVLHMTMSGQDFKTMWKGVPVVTLILFLLCTIFKIVLI